MQEKEQFFEPESRSRRPDPPQAGSYSTKPPDVRGGKIAKAQPFREHVSELRLRLMYSIAALFLGSIAGYVLHGWLFRLIKAPLNEQLYYTTPTGGFNAIIKISILFGLVVTIPVFVYQLGKFLSPAFRHRVRAAPIIFSSVTLGILGVLFAYYVSLPATLHFLANVDSKELQSLITVNEYLNFVSAYVAGFALLFQLPLILLFINRIKPQRPAKLMGIQRYVILISFLLAAVLTPTPDPINQLMVALPIILLYQFSVALIWHVNRKNKALEIRPAPLPKTAAIYGADTYNAPAPLPTPLPHTPTAAGRRESQLILDVFWVPQKPSI